MLGIKDRDLFKVLLEIPPETVSQLFKNVVDTIDGKEVDVDGYDRLLLVQMMSVGDSPRACNARKIGKEGGRPRKDA